MRECDKIYHYKIIDVEQTKKIDNTCSQKYSLNQSWIRSMIHFIHNVTNQYLTHNIFILVPIVKQLKVL